MKKSWLKRVFAGVFAMVLVLGWSGGEISAAGNGMLQIGFELMAKEKLGAVGMGAETGEIVGLLGEPQEKSPEVVWGADGREHQQWKYLDAGLEIGFVKEGSVQKVDRIRAKSPCTLKTLRGIGIGSSEKETLDAYRAEVDPKNASPNRIVAGSIYGGIIFLLQDGAVSSIFIGAAAE